MKLSFKKISNGVQSRVRKFFNHKVIHPIDCQFSKQRKELSYPPLFIIGAPRSGSTLLMQVLTDAFDFGYMSNLHNAFFGAPAFVEKFLYSRKKRKKSSYSSKHGLVDGYFSPSECGEYWYRFFPKNPLYAPLSAVSHKNMLMFRSSLARFVEASGRPVLFKNMFVSLRLEPILKYIPEALFIVIHRDEVENAHSLLEVRKKIYSNYEHWWSMEPPSINELKKLPAAHQVIEQIRQIHDLINSEFKRFNVDEKRVFHVNYEEFCDDVHDMIDKIEQFTKDNNVKVTRLFEVPKKFDIRKTYSIPSELLNEVKKYAAKS